ncbi:EAL domain-containing protein [Dechloromonas sp. TW-R-39-2]|nr:EAL domain-containing protein [Dechloromonas sp. TW-R-39-2]
MRDVPQKKSRPGHQLWLALAALALSGFVLLGYVLWSAYHEIWSEARGMAQGHAELLESRFDATLRRVDANLDSLVAKIPREALDIKAAPRFRQILEADMARHKQSFDELAGFRVLDADGNVLYITGGGEYTNLKDRSYFRTLRNTPGAGIVFSEVLKSRITGRDVLIAARPITAPDGRFLGVVSAAVELDFFGRLFRSVHLGVSGALAIRRLEDHSLIVRQPPAPAEINRSLGEKHPVYLALVNGERQGVLEFNSQADGVKRIYAYRALDKYPFYVLAGLAESDVMAAWQQRAYLVGGLGGILFGCLGLVLVWLFRAQAREVLAAEALRQNRDQLSAAQRIARVGSWEVELPTGLVTCSDELFQIYEIQPPTTGARYEAFLAQVHPEERSVVDKALNDAIARREPLELKYRLLMPDGRIKYILGHSEAIYDADGKPLRVMGTSQDITSQHQMEAQMQLLATAFQFSGEAILITDRDNRIVTVNPAFTRLTGYLPEDAMGRNPSFLSAGRTTSAQYREMWDTVLATGFWQGDIWDRRKDGGIYPKWMSLSLIRDDAGEVRYHVAHFTDVSSERAAEAKLHHIAHHDVLTGLLNRFSLKGRLDQALAAARREGGRVALLFIDLDRFKLINDTLGHHVGDLLLIEVAARLSRGVRDSDVVARLGGDEFVIMLSGIEHTTSVAGVAEKLVRSVGDPYLIEGHDLYTTPSVGIAIFPTDGDDGEVLMKNADAAMYHAKTAGRNNFQFFDAKMNDAAVERLKTEHSLRLALTRNEFCLHFQPLIDVRSGRVAGVEALVRWQHPEHGLTAPGKFIGIAEETGLIQPLGEWVFWEACRQLAAFTQAGIRNVKMGVNISAIQMRNGNLPILAKGAIEALEINPADLVFEITESVAMQHPAETVRILDLLHDMGISLAIDDFGTGYSSLSYLRMFPIDHIKLDRSFVEEIGQDGDGAAICNATIGLTHSLGLKLVAEGVETQAQFDYLRSQDCDLVQGFLFSRPVPAEDVIAFIKQRNS